MIDRKKGNLFRLSFRMIILVAALALFAHGCATVPKENPALTSAKAAYEKAKSDPTVVTNASVPLYEAGETLKSAEMATSEAEVKHLAYLAEKRTAVAVATAEQKLAEAERKKLAAEKDGIVLEQREQQVRKARGDALAASQEADKQRMESEQRAREADEARKLAELRRLEAEKSAQEAESRTAEALESHKRAEAATAKAKAMEQELAELKAKKTDRGFVLTLGDILFAFGKADLMPGAQRTIDRLAAFLIKYSTMKVALEGHTDSVGSAEYNVMLSQQRAESVRSAIVERGINPDRISTKGLGELYPVASNADFAGRQQNRRVEVLFLSGEETPANQ